MAVRLANLAKSLEQSGYRADHVGAFLTRCLFSMFAEGVKLLPKGSFLNLLQTWREQPATLPEQVRAVAAVLASGNAALPLDALGRARREGNAWSS